MIVALYYEIIEIYLVYIAVTTVIQIKNANFIHTKCEQTFHKTQVYYTFTQNLILSTNKQCKIY